jgi:hypothetical protein
MAAAAPRMMSCGVTVWYPAGMGATRFRARATGFLALEALAALAARAGFRPLVGFFLMGSPSFPGWG